MFTTMTTLMFTTMTMLTFTTHTVTLVCHTLVSIIKFEAIHNMEGFTTWGVIVWVITGITAIV